MKPHAKEELETSYKNIRLSQHKFTKHTTQVFTTHTNAQKNMVKLLVFEITLDAVLFFKKKWNNQLDVPKLCVMVNCF